MISSRFRPAAALLLLFAGTAACAVQDEAVAPATHVAAVGAPHDAGHALPAAPRPSAEELRLRLEQSLGHHSILMVRLMRGALNPRPDFGQAATAALGRNTDELAAEVESVYGTAAGQDFKRLWAEHIVSLYDYARGLAEDNSDAQSRAKAALDQYVSRYGAAIASLTRGKLPADVVAKGVRMHIDELLQAADAYAARDYALAYKREREAYAHMFTTGRGLAAAAASQATGELPAGFDAPPERLRSTLGLLLGEHMQLTVDATRAIIGKSAEFEQAAAALNGNTRDIAQAADGVFGREQAARFSNLWAGHINAVVSFATAHLERDGAREARARADLDRIARDVAAFLSATARGKVAARTAAAAIQQHDEQLLAEVVAFAAGDFTTAHNISYDGYNHMFDIARVFAAAIEGKVTAQIPRGGAATGWGGVASASATAHHG